MDSLVSVIDTHSHVNNLVPQTGLQNPSMLRHSLAASNHLSNCCSVQALFHMKMPKLLKVRNSHGISPGNLLWQKFHSKIPQIGVYCIGIFILVLYTPHIIGSTYNPLYQTTNNQPGCCLNNCSDDPKAKASQSPKQPGRSLSRRVSASICHGCFKDVSLRMHVWYIHLHLVDYGKCR